MIEDYDSYFDVDQAILKRQFPPALTTPALIEVMSDHPSILDQPGLLADIIRLKPQYVVVSTSSSEILAEYAQIESEQIELRGCHRITSELEETPSYELFPASKLILDISQLTAPSQLAVIEKQLVEALQSVMIPVKCILSVSDDTFSYFEQSLHTLSQGCPSVTSVSIRMHDTFPETTESYRYLLGIMLRYASVFQFSSINYYRFARLHLYYRLPLLRLVIQEDLSVLPLPHSPFALGSLTELSLFDIWRQSRELFWKLPHVQEAFAHIYRMAEMQEKRS